jgi:hypothetical protein
VKTFCFTLIKLGGDMSKFYNAILVIILLFSVSTFAQKKCLYIVTSTSLSAEDQVINDKLVEWGYDVTPTASSDLAFFLTPDFYADYDFAFVSESIGSGDLAKGIFKTIPLPTASLEGWAEKPGALDWEANPRTVNNFNEGDVTIVDNTNSPLAAGFSNGSTVTLITDTQNGAIVASNPDIPIIPIAVLSSDDTMKVIYGVEAGTINVVGDTIQNRIATVGINATGYTSLTDDAFKFMKAAIDWIMTSPTGVTEKQYQPSRFELSQNFPNPFNPTTTIQFDIQKSGYYSLKVYNLLGQEVATLVAGNKSAGRYSVNFDASNLTSGMYVYRLSGNNVNLTRKMLLMK